jgi:hypothetical protein
MFGCNSWDEHEDDWDELIEVLYFLYLIQSKSKDLVVDFWVKDDSNSSD